MRNHPSAMVYQGHIHWGAAYYATNSGLVATTSWTPSGDPSHVSSQAEQRIGQSSAMRRLLAPAALYLRQFQLSWTPKD
jgi:hypothetical protein